MDTICKAAIVLLICAAPAQAHETNLRYREVCGSYNDSAGLSLPESLNRTVFTREIAGQLNLEGKTLIFTSPIAVITFKGSSLKADDIKKQINAVVGGVAYQIYVTQGTYRDRLALSLPGGLTISKAGTANTDLGLSSDSDTAQMPYSPSKLVGYSTYVRQRVNEDYIGSCVLIDTQ